MVPRPHDADGAAIVGPNIASYVYGAELSGTKHVQTAGKLHL